MFVLTVKINYLFCYLNSIFYYYTHFIRKVLLICINNHVDAPEESEFVQVVDVHTSIGTLLEPEFVEDSRAKV